MTECALMHDDITGDACGDFVPDHHDESFCHVCGHDESCHNLAGGAPDA